jgi:hypothetical protein
MSSKKARKKLKPKNVIVNYLHAYVSWSAGFRSFRILNGDSLEIITERNLYQNGKTCWFNIVNVKNEVKEYAKNNNLSMEGLGELFICIEDEGLSYHNKEIIKKKSEERGILLID